MKTAFLFLLLAASALAQELTSVQPTFEDVTTALGLKSYCWDVTSPEPIYARLIAHSSQGDEVVALKEAKTSFQVRIFAFAPANGSSGIHHVTYTLKTEKGGGETLYDYSLNGCDITEITTVGKPNIKVTFKGAISTGNQVTLSITLETSKEPFPARAPGKQ